MRLETNLEVEIFETAACKPHGVLRPISRYLCWLQSRPSIPFPDTMKQSGSIDPSQQWSHAQTGTAVILVL